MSELETIKRISATEQVMETIKRCIREGKLKVGDKLPNETELAKSIGVGRSSLREGIRMLSSFGIIEIKHGDGMYVADNSAERIFGFMGYEPDPDNISHMLGLRKVIEIGSIKIVAGRFTQEQYDYLAPLVDQIRSAQENPEKVEEADRLFHEKIVSYTDNPLIIVIYKMMTKMLRIVFHDLMYHEEVKENAYKAHMEVLRALHRRDVEGSARALDNHLSQVNYYAHKYALIYKDV
ncbi:MAG: FadR family transcriptional regulator [Clostridiales bacterium]|nr:FadR family transcriptional regulator [Clostridiales bacterium]